MAELVAYAKARPKQLNYGSVGVGSSQHLAGAYFEQIAGVELTHVPYRNIAQYVPDLIAGSVPLGFQLLPNVNAPLQSKEARALAVTISKRMTALPDIPTVGEAGISNYEILGLARPAGAARNPKGHCRSASSGNGGCAVRPGRAQPVRRPRGGADPHDSCRAP